MAKRQKPLLFRVQEIQPDGSRTAKTIRADQIKVAKRAVRSLSDEQNRRALALWNRVGQYARPDATPKEWLDTFCHDQHPDAELNAWEKIAKTFEAAGGVSLPSDQTRTILRAILLISMRAVDVESQTGLSEKIVSMLREAYELPG